MLWVCIAVQLVAATLAWWRALRVAQREHYVPGSVTRSVARWYVQPASALLLLLAAALAGAAVDGPRPWFALASAVVVAPLPLGLRGVRGTPTLAWTPRVIRVAVLTDLLGVLVVGGLALGGIRVEAALAGALIVLAAVTDVALWIAKPIEQRLLVRRFVVPAERKLRQLAPDVAAVTGSFGKTSVKEHLRDLLGRTRQVTASPASFNNQAGLARTVNDHLTPGTEVLICEMGTYGPGEIAAMCRWVRPRVSAICRIGPVHLERMKTLEGIRDAKAEILEGAEVAVLNVDDPLLAELADRVESRQQVIRTSTDRSTRADVVVEPGDAGARATVAVRGEVVAEGVAIPSGVHASNVAVALGMALGLGADVARLVDGIGSLLPPSHRLEGAANDAGVVVLDDTFNSNPTGAAAALAALMSSGEPGGRKVVVTPGMVELGTQQVEENRRFAAAVAAAGAELVVVGRVNRGALVAGYDAARPPVVVRDRAEAVAWVRSQLSAGDAVLYENDLPDHYP